MALITYQKYGAYDDRFQLWFIIDDAALRLDSVGWVNNLGKTVPLTVSEGARTRTFNVPPGSTNPPAAGGSAPVSIPKQQNFTYTREPGTDGGFSENFQVDFSLGDVG